MSSSGATKSPVRFDARWLTEVLLLAVAYFVVARIGLQLAMPGGHVTPVWPASGLALAAVLLRGRRIWPGIWLGSFAANAVDFSSGPGNSALWFAVPVAFASGSSLAAVWGGRWLRRFIGEHNPLDRVRDVCLLLTLGGLASCLVSATVGVASLRFAGTTPWNGVGNTWLTWWLGDTAGVFVVTPFLLAWSQGWRLGARPRLLEATACFGLLIGTTTYVFVEHSFSMFHDTALTFLLGPFLIWAAVRFGQRGAVTATALVALLATWGTISQTGPFSDSPRHEVLLLLELFLSVTVFTTLCIAAMLTESKAAEAARARALVEVEARVQARTEELAKREAEAQRDLQVAEHSRAALLSIMEDKASAEAALRDAESHLRLATEAGRVGIWDLDASTQKITWSPVHEELWGMVPGEFDGTLRAFESRLHPEDRAEVREALETALVRRELYQHEFRLLLPDGRVRWVAGEGRGLYDDTGQATRMVGVVRDITERKLAEAVIRHLSRVYEFLSEINQMIVRERDPEKVLHAACQIALEKGDFTLACVGLIDSTRGVHRIVAQAGGNGAETELRSDPRPGGEKSFTTEVLQTRATAVCDDIETDVRTEPWRGEALARKFRGVIALPLMVGDELVGTFTLYVSQRGFFNDAEVRLLNELAGDLGFAIEVGRREAERRRSEQLLAWEKGALELMTSTREEEVILDGLMSGLEQLLPGSHCSVLLLEVDGKTLRRGAAPSLPKAYAEAIDGVEIGPGVGSCGTAVYENRQVIVLDIQTDPLWADDRDLAAAHGLRACWSTPFHDTNGKILGSFAIYFREPRAATREELAWIDRACHIVSLAVERRRTEERVNRQAAFPELNPNPVFEFSATGILSYSNAAARTLATDLGFPEVQELLPPATTKIITTALDTGQPRLRLETKHGARTLTWSFFPIKRLRTVHCYVIEITDRLNLEEQFRQSQKMEAIGQLSGGVAHDFNNIITVIKGRTSLLLRELPAGSAQAASMREIEDAADRAATLTRQLLAFSRRQVMQQRALDLNDAVHTIIGMLRRLLGEHVKVTLGFSAEALWTHTDPGMLEQVLINLAVNARDAMPDGGELTIETSSEVVADPTTRRWPQALPGPFVKLAVRDTGTGISPEIITKIFEPFFTTKGVGEGTGLGLATVYGIVQQHGGGIDVTSIVGHGATFSIYLPRIGAPHAVATEPLVTPEIKGGTETILLVEDELAVQHIAQLVLERMGYEILVAATGAEALNVWTAHRDKIKLLLTDLVMPDGVNGHELARRLKLEKPSLRVIYSSGYSASVAGRDFPLDANANFLGKPYDIDDLTAIVRSTLDRDASVHPFGD